MNDHLKYMKLNQRTRIYLEIKVLMTVISPKNGVNNTPGAKAWVFEAE